jgi:hypothetical protein
MAHKLGLAGLFLILSSAADAAIVGVALGPDAPPATMGGYDMIPFPPDPSGLTSVLSVDGPTGEITFDHPMFHTHIGEVWATWSHGYTGDVYRSNGTGRVRITLPPDTGAFIVYAEPDPFQLFTMTATADDGTVVSQQVHGDSGASGFGFYATGNDVLQSVFVEEAGIPPVDIAVGEFLIAPIPEPATFALLALGCAWVVRRR